MQKIEIEKNQQNRQALPELRPIKWYLPRVFQLKNKTPNTNTRCISFES